MFTFVRTTVAQPGHLFELIAAGTEVVSIIKKLVGGDVTFCSTLGGNVAEISWIWQAESIEAQDEMTAKLMANAEYLAIYQKIGSLVVPNTSVDKIYRHI